MPDREAAKRIFMAALDLDPPERPAFITKECNADAALQREVEALLAAHEGKPILDPATLPAQPANNASPKSKNIAGSARVGEEIGPYRLLERIGEGGFGEVWIAEQKTPVRRKVALKIIKAGMDTREVLARFEAERQALAVMDHPSVAKVFDAGATAGGRPYFVMEFVAGLPINAYCDSAKLRIKERLALFMSICHAVQHAHQKGIIHRDLKPGNIIVTLQDGKPVPKVIDFGIAKATVGRLTERTLHTETGRVIGTPEYMAPEQAGTSGLDVDTRADIYSLGVILYELLTGTLPLDGNTLRSAGIEAVGRMLNEFEPPKPSTRLSTLVNEPVTRGRAEPAAIAKTHGADLRTLQRELRGDLDWITLKALEKDRTRRYETASAFAADVDRHLTGEPVIAAPPSVGYRLRKFVRKHKAGTFIAATLVLATITTSGLSVWAINERSQKERERARAEEQTRFAELANKGMRSLVKQAKDGLQQLVSELSPGATLTITRGKEDGTGVELDIPEDEDGMAILLLTQFGVEAVRQSKANRREAELQRDAAELETYIARIAAAQTAMSANNWPEARELLDACSSEKRGWEWWFLRQRAESMRVEIGPMKSVSFSPDGMLILAVSFGGSLRLWDAKGGKPVGDLIKHQCVIESALISPNNKFALTLSSDGAAQLWDVETCKPFGNSIKHDSAISYALFSPNSKLILAASSDGAARLWDVESRKPLGNSIKYVSAVNPAVFSPDGKLILTASEDTARLWDVETCRLIGDSVKHDSTIITADFSPDGKLILTASYDGTARLWDVETSKAVGKTMTHQSRSTPAVFSPDGKLVLTASSDRTAQIWDSATCKPIGHPMRCKTPLASAVFSPDGKLILIALRSGAVRLWDAATGEPIANDRHSDGRILSAKFSPDGSHINIIRTLDFFSAGCEVIDLDRFDPSERALIGENVELEIAEMMDASNPDEAHNARTQINEPRRSNGVKLPSLPSPSIAGSVPSSNSATPIPYGHGAAQGDNKNVDGDLHYNEVLTPDGLRLVRLKEASLRFYDASTDRELAAFTLPAPAESVQFSPDGARLVVRLENNSVIIWDTREPAARRADLEARHAERRHAEAYVETLLAGPLTNRELIPALSADPRLSPLRRVVAMQELRESISFEGLVRNARSRIELHGRNGAARALERLKVAMQDGLFGEHYRIDGRVEGRKLTFEYREEGVTGYGWFKLSENGNSFAGNWRVSGSESWSDWNGTRTHGDDPARFDGLWNSKYGTMWLFTDGDKIHGYYGINSAAVEAIILIEGYTSSLEPTTKPLDSPHEDSFNPLIADSLPIPSPTTQQSSK